MQTGSRLTARRAMRSHWPEYLMEAAGLGLFMISAFVGRIWQDLWIYFTAPPLGLLLAAELTC